jgi:HAMP domain-containing protein
MKLTAKFNLIFIVISALALTATGMVASKFLESGARDQVVQQARLIMDTSQATRNYTSQQIRPLLLQLQRNNKVFYPQTVPAFSATKIFNYLRKSYPDYAYKEATLNPTNLEDRAADWEADVVNVFRKDPNQSEFIGVRETPAGPSLFLAKPIKSVESCMECHSVPSAAPPAMIKLYGGNNGFGWKLNEIVAAQIVSVPMAIPNAIAEGALRSLMVWMGTISLLSLLLLNVVLIVAIVRPVKRLSVAADEISKGNLNVPELEVKGSDEVSVLADSFNRMHRSLVKAIKMLEE